MYFCIGSNEVVFGTRRLAIMPIGFELSITVERGTFSIHWYKTVDRFWSLDLPWRPQLVNVVWEQKSKFTAVDIDQNLREYKEYEIHELFVPWFISRFPILHRLFKWQSSVAIGINRSNKETYRRVKSVDAWLLRNNLERINHAKPRLRLSANTAPTG